MNARRETIEDLRKRIRRVETVSLQHRDAALVVSTGCEAVDAMLPDGGYRRGALVEWLSAAPGCGAEVLAWLTAIRASSCGGAIVVVDPRREIFPPAAVGWGASFAPCLAVQPQTDADAYWAIDQALRCPAVAAVWSVAALGGSHSGDFLGGVNERWLRRFQLAAEAGGTLGLFVRPISEARRPSWCDFRWLLAARSNTERCASRHRWRDQLTATAAGRENISLCDDEQAWRLIDVQLLKCRGGTTAGQTLSLALNMVTGQMQKLDRPVSAATSHSRSMLAVEAREKSV